MKIITIGNNKGGTGKTTITTHIGVALSKLNHRVLVIDNDSQCNATSLLLSGVNFKYSMYDFLTDPVGSDKEYEVSTPFPNLYCLPNVVDTSGLSLEFTKTYPNSLFIMKLALEKIQEKYDYILIDCPPTLDIPMSMALCASNAVIIPVEVGSLHSIDGLDKCLDLIEAMQELNPQLTFLKLVMNRADKRTSISKIMIDEIKRNYKGEYFETIISVCTALQQAEYLRKTLYEYSQTHVSLKLYKQLAKEVITLLPSKGE
ncbi:MAG: ParA family protein [Proteobacteria bacterium]|nr:ParA family protein [Pseudomonadota bacterium]MBU1586308.1 ParA family protein [Pseudomonadota bacterium]MBU2431913.1 ParA family protein [Pseudomonadota bacterium]MBU2630781.1 ParA family protein [Pseudomonadota bacterium]